MEFSAKPVNPESTIDRPSAKEIASTIFTKNSQEEQASTLELLDTSSQLTQMEMGLKMNFKVELLGPTFLLSLLTQLEKPSMKLASKAPKQDIPSSTQGWYSKMELLTWLTHQLTPSLSQLNLL